MRDSGPSFGRFCRLVEFVVCMRCPRRILLLAVLPVPFLRWCISRAAAVFVTVGQSLALCGMSRSYFRYSYESQ